MKKLLTILFLFTVIGNISAEISVKSFRKLENDLDARVNEPIKDFNGDVSAIIKVVTPQTGFTFDCGQAGIVKTVNKPTEIWVYVPYGVKRITIMHPQLGQLRDWIFTQPIEKATVYEMVLTTGKVITTVEETIESQWLVVIPQPEKAMIYIDDVFVSKGEYQAQRVPGTYNYRVEAPLHHTEAGKLEITDGKKELKVNLKPAYGFLNINTSPELGATILIDGKELTNTSPATSEALASGEHTVQVIKEMFQPASQKVIVTDGQTSSVNFNLVPNFAELNITTPDKANILINGQNKGKGTWSGRLNAGVYSLEAQLDKHRPAKQDVELIIGENKKIELQPTPIYGSVNILTTPSGATITMNGKDYGTTPNKINKLLIGDNTLQLSKAGYANVTKIITISEGKTVEINETLINGRAVSITSTPVGATLFIDGIPSGTTPYSGSLTFGNHTLRIENDGKKDEQTVSIMQTGGEPNFTLSFVLLRITDIEGNVYNTVTIGTQTWMVENLKVTHYRNGDKIKGLTTKDGNYASINIGAYWQSNDLSNDNPDNDRYHGMLYNWYVINDSRNIAPIGWHIPSYDEWLILIKYLGGEKVAGDKLKESGTANWKSTNSKTCTDESRFTAIPRGWRDPLGGTLRGFGYKAYFWSTYFYNEYIYCLLLSNNKSNAEMTFMGKNNFLSIRCIKDTDNQSEVITKDSKIKAPVIENTPTKPARPNEENTTKGYESPTYINGSGYSPTYNTGSGYSSPTYNSSNSNYSPSNRSKNVRSNPATKKN